MIDFYFIIVVNNYSNRNQNLKIVLILCIIVDSIPIARRNYSIIQKPQTKISILEERIMVRNIGFTQNSSKDIYKGFLYNF